MSSFYTRLGFFVICSMLQSGEGQCPPPPPIPFTNYFAEWFLVGTKVRYECEKGFKRISGRSNLIICTNQSGRSQWTCKLPPACLDDFDLKNISLEQPPTESCKGSSNQSQTPSQQVMDGLCRVPHPIRHATTKVVTYPVGQKLIYVCQGGDEDWNVSTCENSGGNSVWSSFSLPCTNGNKVTEETPTFRVTGTQKPTGGNLNSGTVLPAAIWMMVLIFPGIVIGCTWYWVLAALLSQLYPALPDLTDATLLGKKLTWSCF